MTVAEFVSFVALAAKAEPEIAKFLHDLLDGDELATDRVRDLMPEKSATAKALSELRDV